MGLTAGRAAPLPAQQKRRAQRAFGFGNVIVGGGKGHVWIAFCPARKGAWQINNKHRVQRINIARSFFRRLRRNVFQGPYQLMSNALIRYPGQPCHEKDTLMKLATATAIMLMLGAWPALASTERGAMMPMMPAFDFEAADADGDGAITLEEWTAYVGDRMQTRRAAMIERRADQLIEAGDSDGDGLLSREELVTALEAQHDTFRARMAERSEARSERRAERAEGTRAERRAERRTEGMSGHRADRRGRGHGPHMHHGRMMTPEDFAARSFSRLDADGDGVISADEFSAAQERWAGHPRRNRATQSN